MNDLPDRGDLALKDCLVRSGDGTARVLDISHLRLVIEAAEPWASQPEGEPMATEFSLDRSRFNASVAVRPGGTAERLRLGFERILPSARSALRAYLSPKRVGESLLARRRDEVAPARWRRYQGLNESELWFDPDGGVLFTYLDAADVDVTFHFVVQLLDHRSALRVGRMLRQDFLRLESAEAAEGEIPLLPLSDREAYAKLGECRDIVTNFRPSAPAEYALKQRLLRALSETMYSTSHKVDMAAARPSSAPAPSTSTSSTGS